MCPFRRTNQPPAPRGSQYRSTLALEGSPADGGSEPPVSFGHACPPMTPPPCLPFTFLREYARHGVAPRHTAGSGVRHTAHFALGDDARVRSVVFNRWCDLVHHRHLGFHAFGFEMTGY